MRLSTVLAAFIDTDEYIVLYDNTSSLPALLREYRAYPALRISWRLFGSSGWVERPPNGMLRSYTACEPLPHHNFKSIVQPVQVVAVKNAHNFDYTPASREPGEGVPPAGCLTESGSISLSRTVLLGLSRQRGAQLELSSATVPFLPWPILTQRWRAPPVTAPVSGSTTTSPAAAKTGRTR